MKTDALAPIDLPQSPPRTALPPSIAAAFPGLEVLRAVIPSWIAWLRVHAGERGSAEMARDVKAKLGKLYATEKAAMARWQARLLRAHVAEPEDDYSWLDDDPEDWPVTETKGPARRAAPFQTAHNQGPRLDRKGLFCWAVIKQNKYLRQNSRPYPGRNARQRQDSLSIGIFTPRRSRGLFRGPWPIEVTASDFLDVHDIDEIIILERSTLNQTHFNR